MAYTTIKKPSDYFNTKLYTANGGTLSVTGVGFQPDFTWIKDRDRSGYNHRLQDSVRGATKSLISNLSNAEQTNADAVKSFNSDGFVLGNDAGNGSFNGNSNFVSWNWLGANGTVANTDGDIASTVSASATSGFSIVSYTGTGSNATIGHGLGATPQVVLIKELNGTNNWLMSHQPLSASLGDYTRFMTLNSNSAVSGAGNVVFQNSAFTSSVFNVGTSVGSNGSGQNFIAYCFADVKGFSKMGSYIGNGSTDGTFVYTGFKPAFLIVKNVDAGEAWGMHDNKRPGLGNGNAPVGHFELYPNLSNAENSAGAAGQIDFLSNGFKLRTATNSLNVTQNYIYMAFAEQPLVGDNPCTAR